VKILWRCLITASIAATGQACGAQGTATLPAGAFVLENCVTGPSIGIGATDKRAVLDDSDRDAVQAAIVARYPKLEGDGFAPAHVLLWQRSPDEWLYVNLMLRSSNPDTFCFTATFAAKRFEFTEPLIKKYFFAKTASL
jgi:hypothetical protein